MATVHGKDTKIYLNGYDATAGFNGCDIAISIDNAEDTAYNDEFRSRVVGLHDGTVSLSGFFDVAAGGPDAIIGPAFGTGHDIVTVLVGGDSNGGVSYCVESHNSTYTPSAPVDDVVRIAAEYQGDLGVHRPLVLHALGAETSNGSSTAIDHGSQTTLGGVAYCHFTASAGSFGSMALVVEDSADNSTFASLGAFTSITADNSFEKIEISGTVERYVRLSWTLTTITSGTFWVGFQRFV